MLDYGYRSRCCRAPIRLAFKKSSLSNIKHQVWACTKCRRTDVDIISNKEMDSQVESKFSEKEDDFRG
jgi:hypothetical protein